MPGATEYADMQECIPTAISQLDEAEPLLSVEPLDHGGGLGAARRCRARRTERRRPAAGLIGAVRDERFGPAARRREVVVAASVASAPSGAVIGTAVRCAHEQSQFAGAEDIGTMNAGAKP